MRQCLFLTTLYTFVSTSIACSGLNIGGAVKTEEEAAWGSDEFMKGFYGTK